MRDPRPLDRDEENIEEVRRFLEPFVRDPRWKADEPDDFGLFVAMAHIKNDADMPPGPKAEALAVLGKATGKRPRGKPTLDWRDERIVDAARRLAEHGYRRFRNEAKRETHCQTSVIQAALQRLGVKLSENQIKAILLKRDVLG